MRSIQPAGKQRLARWALASSLNASLSGAIGYVVWQPVLLALMHLASDMPIGFSSVAMWTRFELSEFGLGSLAGAIFFYSRRWRLRSWQRDWAECAVPGFAFAAAANARHLLAMPADLWVATALLCGTVTAALFACVTQGIRRLVRRPTIQTEADPSDVLLD